MSRPKLAIVGRPNVGKSALFNRICKKRVAIVDEAEGVTRDRIFWDSDIFGRPFRLIDTGGINLTSKEKFNDRIKEQAQYAIDEADALIFVVDGTVGATTLDLDVAKILHTTKKPVVVAVNKIDNFSKRDLIHQFYSLGFDKVIGISALQGYQIAELLQMALEDIDDQAIEEEEQEEGVKVAVVGKPNVGKSSLINYLLDEERCLVSPEPGATRDSIDVPFHYEGNPYTFIDTAGIRRKRAEHFAVDKFASIRTKNAIERSDVCLLMVDARCGIQQQDKKIANMIEKEGKGCIVLLNKWDLVKGVRMEHLLKELHEALPFLRHCPKLFLSAKTGRNVTKIFSLIDSVNEQLNRRITTHQLNTFVERAIQLNHPPMIKGKRLRIYYTTQVATKPPRFVFFVNNPAFMSDSYKKYLENRFRQVYGFEGAPLTFFLRAKEKRAKKS